MNSTRLLPAPKRSPTNELDAEVWAGEERLAVQTFRYGEAAQPLRVHLPHALLDAERRVPLDLRLRDPARPVDLGLGRDARRLGFHLRSLTIEEPALRLSVDESVARRETV